MLYLLLIYIIGWIVVFIINLRLVYRDRHKVFYWSFKTRKQKAIHVGAAILGSAQFSFLWFWWTFLWLLGKWAKWYTERQAAKYDNFKT